MTNPAISKVSVDLIEMRNGRSAIVREIGAVDVAGLPIKVEMHVNDGAIELRPVDEFGRVYQISLTQLVERAADQVKCYHAALAEDIKPRAAS